MSGNLGDADRRFLQRAIQVSRRALEDDGKTPFGALVVIGGQVVGEGPAAWSSFMIRPRTPR